MADKKRIVLAEDDNVLRNILADKLERSGYLVDRAEDGVVALEKIRVKRPDCILLDILMPRKGGIEVLEELHTDENLKNIPIVIISNSGQPVEIKRAQELGAREFLIKAVFDPNEVLEKVERVLSVNPTAHLQSAEASRTISEITPAASASMDPVVSKIKKNILIIEDDKFLRELLVRKFVADGFDVKNAINAELAFTVLEGYKPDAILCDLILPGVSGFEILKKVKEDPKTSSTPVIILSNLGQKEDFERAMSLGASDFMVKANFTLDEIVDKVQSVLELRK